MASSPSSPNLVGSLPLSRPSVSVADPSHGPLILAPTRLSPADADPSSVIGASLSSSSVGSGFSGPATSAGSGQLTSALTESAGSVYLSLM